MCPYLETGMGTWELYNVMTTMGAVISVILQMVMLYHGTKKFRCIIFSSLYGAYSFLGGYISSLVRQTSYGKQIEGDMFENVANGIGKHYMGIVFACAILVLPCTRLVCRILRLKKEQWKETEKVVRNSLGVGILVHHICVRLGCFFRGCCYGKYYDGIFSITMPDAGISYPVFPSQLLEVFLSVVLLGVVILLLRKKREILGLTFAGYAMNIIITENYMAQMGFGKIWGITIIQWWAIVLLLYSVLYSIMIKWRW